MRKDKVVMEIKYTFVNGEETSIEVYGDFEGIILELDRDLKNNNRKETRRHESLSLLDSDKQSIATNTDVYSQTLKNLDKDKLYTAIAKLSPNEQDFIKKVFLQNRPVTYTEYAKSIGVKVDTLYQKMWRIKKKLIYLLNQTSEM